MPVLVSSSQFSGEPNDIQGFRRRTPSFVMTAKAHFWLKYVLSVRFRTVGLQTPYIGVDARYFQRTARFQRTLRKLLTGEPLLAALLDEGYCDQSHFIKNCQFFTQRSPGHLLTSEQMALNHYNPQISKLVGFI